MVGGAFEGFDFAHPPAPEPPFVPATPSKNDRYLQLKELLTLLEEDRVKASNGNTKAKAFYRRKAKIAKQAIQNLRLALGISGTTRSKRISPPSSEE